MANLNKTSLKDRSAGISGDKKASTSKRFRRKMDAAVDQAKNQLEGLAEKAHNEFEQVVTNLKKSEFLENPMIQDLIHKVKSSQSPNSRTTVARKKSETGVTEKSKKAVNLDVSQLELHESSRVGESDLLKRLVSRDVRLDSDVARKIAESVIEHAQIVRAGLVTRSREGVDFIQKVSAPVKAYMTQQWNELESLKNDGLASLSQKKSKKKAAQILAQELASKKKKAKTSKKTKKSVSVKKAKTKSSR